MRLEELFGRNVRQLRKAKGMTQEALADEVELAVSYLGQIERGERNPTLSVVARFAEVLGVTPVELISPSPRN